MGEGWKGWTEARKNIVAANIKEKDIVFLQEVQWAESGTKDIAKQEYEVLLEKSEHGNRNNCILYNAKRLHLEDKETDKVVKTLAKEEHWTAYSKRLCVQVFSLKGKEGLGSSNFVAISLHAPTGTDGNYLFCDLMKTVIKKIVVNHKLPVLVGGDFNTDIRWWEKDGFEGLHYDAGRNPIDFITMKVPRKNNHLKVDKRVQKIKPKKIDISGNKDREVVLRDGSRTTVERLKDDAVDNFCLHLCGYHMPLTVDIVYDDTPTEGDEGKKMSWEEHLEAENDNLRSEIEKLKKIIEEMKKQHPAELSESKRKPKS